MNARYLLAFSLISVALPGGCTSYTSAPGIEARGAAEGPNAPRAESAALAALQFAVTRYPPGGPRPEASTSREASSLTADFPLAVNMPVGTRRGVYERVAIRLGAQAVPYDVGTTLPIYSVERVWVRERTATVDVLRPMLELPRRADATPVYQRLTVRLEGSFSPWRVVHTRAWPPIGDERPVLFPIPAIDRHDEYERAIGAKTPATEAPATETSDEE